MGRSQRFELDAVTLQMVSLPWIVCLGRPLLVTVWNNILILGAGWVIICGFRLFKGNISHDWTSAEWILSSHGFVALDSKLGQRGEIIQLKLFHYPPMYISDISPRNLLLILLPFPCFFFIYIQLYSVLIDNNRTILGELLSIFNVWYTDLLFSSAPWTHLLPVGVTCAALRHQPLRCACLYVGRSGSARWGEKDWAGRLLSSRRSGESTANV